MKVEEYNEGRTNADVSDYTWVRALHLLISSRCFLLFQGGYVDNIMDILSSLLILSDKI